MCTCGKRGAHTETDLGSWELHASFIWGQVYPWDPRKPPLASSTHMSIHSPVAGQAELVWVLGEVCRVGVYEHSSGPKVLGTGHLGKGDG